MKTQPVTIGRNTTAAEERTDPRGRAAIAVLAALAVSCVGLIAFVIFMVRTTMGRFTPAQATSAIVVSYYWHFVDVVWIALYAMIYWLQ